jgi:hypothetical protein
LWLFLVAAGLCRRAGPGSSWSARSAAPTGAGTGGKPRATAADHSLPPRRRSARPQSMDSSRPPPRITGKSGRRQASGQPMAKPSVFGRETALPVRDIPARLPSVAMPTRGEVPAAALTKLVLTILSLAGRTAPRWPCSHMRRRCSWRRCSWRERVIPISAPGRKRAPAVYDDLSGAHRGAAGTEHGSLPA